MIKNILKLFPVGWFLLASLSQAQEMRSLDQFLNEVKNTNPEIKSLDLTLQSMGEKILELDMIYPLLFRGNYTYTDDKSGPGFGSSLPTDEMKASIWSLGANTKFPFGTTLSLGYSNSAASFNLASPAITFRAAAHYKFYWL